MKANYLKSSALVAVLTQALTTKDPSIIEGSYKTIKGVKHPTKEVPATFGQDTESILFAIYYLLKIRTDLKEAPVEKFLKDLTEALTRATHDDSKPDQVCPHCGQRALWEGCQSLASSRRGGIEELLGGFLGGVTVIGIGGGSLEEILQM